MRSSDRRASRLALAFLLVAARCMGGEDDANLAPLSKSVAGLFEITAVSTYPSEDIDLAVAEAREPRVRHRLVHFSDAEMRVEGPRSITCASPKTSKRTLAFPELLAQSFRGERAMVVPFFESEETVDVLFLHCANGPLRAKLDGDDTLRDVWMLVKPDKIYLRGADGAVWWLDRVDEAAPPKASFACAKAQSATEKAICGSRALAGYDQSVAEAYTTLLGQYATDDAEVRSQREKLVAEQRAWIARRNTRGADVARLEKSLQARIEVLIAAAEKGLVQAGE